MKMSPQEQKSLKVYSLKAAKAVWCRPEENPLLWRKLEVIKVYLLNKTEMYAICPEHYEMIRM